MVAWDVPWEGGSRARSSPYGGQDSAGRVGRVGRKGEVARRCPTQGTARSNLPQRPLLLAPVLLKNADLHRGEERRGTGFS